MDRESVLLRSLEIVNKRSPLHTVWPSLMWICLIMPTWLENTRVTPEVGNNMPWMGTFRAVSNKTKNAMSSDASVTKTAVRTACLKGM